MFLYQKLKYEINRLDEPTTIPFPKDKVVAFDTETSGLNIITDKPFLFVAGFENKVYYWLNKDYCKDYTFKAYAHNAKYDWHMMKNIDIDMPNLMDSKVVARLTTYADEDEGLSLEELGQKYVDDEAKFAGKVIKKHLAEINKVRWSNAKRLVREKFGDVKITPIFDAYYKRVQFIKDEKYQEIFDYIDTIYKYPTYKDVYDAYPDLMISYAIDDVVVLLEYLKKSLQVLDEYYQDKSILDREQKLIEVVGNMERQGFAIDINYLLDSRVKLYEYKNKLYEELQMLTWDKIDVFTANQHKVIKNLFEKQYSISMLSCNVDALEQVVSKTDGEAKRVAEIIIELRTLEKWISTYVEGMLNRVVDGKICPSIDNAGTVTGRVSSDLQQQPKEALLDKDGNELFHPRKAFINKPNQKMYFFDYSQMEMRLQAHYTLILGNGDVNLCRAFMPYKCTSFIDGREFVFKQDDIESNEWVDDNGNLWSPVDLHTMTTLKAFPHLTINDPNFKHYRRLGKMCNFLKNYGGAYKALKNKLKVDDDIIEALNKGYYEAYPQVLNYQKWVTKQLLTYGYIENLFGRKYFVSSSSNYYKAYNYAVQGSCADFFKKKQIILYDLLKDKKSKSLMVIHDEIVVSIDESEEYLVKKIKDIMDDYTLEIPMISGVDCTQTNWAEKVEIE